MQKQHALDFPAEIREALLQGAQHESLLEMVRRHKSTGATQRETYDALQQIWLDFGFDEADQESPMQNELEFVLEVVWYGQRGT